MRKSFIIAAVLGALTGSAHAADMDMSVITCKDFISSEKSDIAIILAWLEGYYTKENDPPILHDNKMGTDAKNLSKYCNEHPGDGLITAAEAVMPVK